MTFSLTDLANAIPTKSTTRATTKTPNVIDINIVHDTLADAPLITCPNLAPVFANARTAYDLLKGNDALTITPNIALSIASKHATFTITSTSNTSPKLDDCDTPRVLANLSQYNVASRRNPRHQMNQLVSLCTIARLVACFSTYLRSCDVTISRTQGNDILYAHTAHSPTAIAHAVACVVCASTDDHRAYAHAFNATFNALTRTTDTDDALSHDYPMTLVTALATLCP